jgi:translocation and assembly module TamB
VYERGLSGVLGELRVFYDFNRRLQLRLEAGDRTGVDLVYTVRIE